MDAITLLTVPEQQVLGVRRRGHYRIIPELLMTIITYAIENGITIAGPPLFLCHEITPEAVMAADQAGSADVEVAWPVSGKVEGAGEIRLYTLPGGRMARILHHGPYEACEPTYRRLFAWIEERGLRIIGPIREAYLNDPREVLPEQILTEIMAPVE
ncbi:MAG: GyrI-like domain-containing protein [Methanomicrobiales archaeon]|nr:GyrI-like domain-containing protein [Methanomicrobiales archaeon]